MNNFGVHIKVKNFSKSQSFYKALGFKKIFEYGPGKKVEESYSGATFVLGTTRIEIADGHRAVKPEVFGMTMTSSKVSLMIPVRSVSVIVARCKRAGISLAVEPRHYYWGTLEVVVRDPDGVVLVFICPYSAIEARKVSASEKFAHQLKN